MPTPVSEAVFFPKRGLEASGAGGRPGRTARRLPHAAGRAPAPHSPLTPPPHASPRPRSHRPSPAEGRRESRSAQSRPEAPPAPTSVLQAGQKLQLLLLVRAVHPAPRRLTSRGYTWQRSGGSRSPGARRARRTARPAPLCTCPDSRGAPVSMCGVRRLRAPGCARHLPDGRRPCGPTEATPRPPGLRGGSGILRCAKEAGRSPGGTRGVALGGVENGLESLGRGNLRAPNAVRLVLAGTEARREALLCSAKDFTECFYTVRREQCAQRFQRSSCGAIPASSVDRTLGQYQSRGLWWSSRSVCL